MANPPLTPPLIEPAWMGIARKEKGVAEIPGTAHNPRILEYFTAVSYSAATDETPWCSAFVNWVILKAGMHPTKLANARSWLQWGVGLKNPRPGCIAVLSADARGSASGHVGFYLSHSATKIRLFGGNQLNKVGEADYELKRLLSYRWPTDQQLKLSDSIARPIVLLFITGALIYALMKA